MSDHSAVLEKWKQHDFFAPDTVVLGIDVGIEGIGIAVRRGSELLYCKSLLVTLPEAEALAERRQMRAARHARKNRRVRMRRLKDLFSLHNLPWVDDDVFSRSDPFLLRYRALFGSNPLASKEALSLCIRSCVERRGYDYFAMQEEGQGEYPWGATANLPDAKKWIASAYVDETMRQYLRDKVSELRLRDKELTDADQQAWLDLVDERAAKAETAGIPAMLKAYYAQRRQYERKARGFNYPRAHVEEHLRTILERHRHLIEDYDAFVAALFRPCLTNADKKYAIFFYNRKTPKEAARHFEKKVKPCPYCEWLGLPQAPCGTKGQAAIRRWSLVDFVATRTFELMEGKLPLGRIRLPEAAVKALSLAIDAEGIRWMDAKKRFEEALSPMKLAKGEWNKGQLEQLRDIVAPDGVVRRRRSGMSVTAAEKLVALVTADGQNLSPESMETARKEINLYEFRARLEATGGIYPQVQTLLGTLRQRQRLEKGSFAVPGFLQQLFERELAPLLGGKTTPDYCVIETVRNAAVNLKQKAEIEKEQKENKEKRRKLAQKYGKENATHAEFLRMRLFEEQRTAVGKNPVCPFTGKDLGDSPFATDLELAHLYPDSRGGLYIAENLVLTTRKVNAEMQNRTPKEAAAASLVGWLPWAEMKEQSRLFRWGKKKRELFEFEPTEEMTFPDFNNITRTAQLAAELRRMVAVWLGIESDVEAMRCRIGNPSGSYTAAARRGMLWPFYEKDRSNTLHHRLDAAVMTCIPPAEGLNDVLYGGIFYTRKDAHKNRTLIAIEGLPTPDFQKEWNQPKGCPIVKQISRSKSKKLGDGTFWRASKEGLLSQRTPLVVGEKTTAATIRATLLKMGVPVDRIPTEKALEAWLIKQTPAVKDDATVTLQPLKLIGGTPVKSIWKFGGKGNMDKSPLGWSGIQTEQGKFDQLRSLSASNDRLEIWLGWNRKKKRWEYYKRLVPTAAALAGLKRMGLPWRGRKNAPAYLLNLLDEQKAPDLRTMICGVLPPHAVKIGAIRKGDMAVLDFPRDDKAVEALRKKSKNWQEDAHPATLRTWGAVSAISSDPRVEISCVTHKERKILKKAVVEDLVKIFLQCDETPEEMAQRLNLHSGE